MAQFKTGNVTHDNDQGLDVRLIEQIAGEDIPNDVQKVEQRFSYITPITTQTTTVVKSGVGFLHSIIIPTPVANAVITIYDNTAASGSQIIPPITFPAALLSSGPVTVPVDCSFAVGLTIVTSGATMGVGGTYR